MVASLGLKLAGLVAIASGSMPFYIATMPQPRSILISQGSPQQEANSAQGQLSNAFRNEVSIEEREGYRYIFSNGIPDHDTGAFPNAGNPNAISAQQHTYRVTLTPELSGTTTIIRPAFGVALNGIPFEPGTGEFWNRDRSSNWKFEALTGFINLGTDHHNAHVQPTGSYHYHGVPTGLVEGVGMAQIGYAADGFPVYGPYGYAETTDASSSVVDIRSSYRLKEGLRPDGPGGLYDGAFLNDFEYVEGLGDLDECNGRFGVTPEHPEGIYHYYITEMFPFIPRCVKGTPDESFRPVGGGHGGSGGRPPGGRPGDGPPGGRPPGGRPPNGRPSNGRPPRGPQSGGRPAGPRAEPYEPSFPAGSAEE